jgi:hypothetical protein
LEYGTSEGALEELFKDHQKFGSGLLKNKKKASEVVRDQLTRLVTLERDRDKVKDHELAVLMSVRSRYASPAPRLALGSIVVESRPQTRGLSSMAFSSSASRASLSCATRIARIEPTSARCAPRRNFSIQ